MQYTYIPCSKSEEYPMIGSTSLFVIVVKFRLFKEYKMYNSYDGHFRK